MITVVRSTMRIPCSGPGMRSVSRGAAVGARLGPALQRAGPGIEEDALVAAAAVLDPRGIVAPALELREDLLRNSLLHGEHSAAFQLGPASRRGRPDVLDARRLAGRLHVH